MATIRFELYVDGKVEDMELLEAVLADDDLRMGVSAEIAGVLSQTVYLVTGKQAGYTVELPVEPVFVRRNGPFILPPLSPDLVSGELYDWEKGDVVEFSWDLEESDDE